jgi:very-short-patch-repair endonuclease
MDYVKARHLRKNLTDAERILWRYLRLRQLEGYKFRRQQPIGEYIVDFVCFEKMLIIEVDGGQHSQQESYDRRREDSLEDQGFQALRFWNNQVIDEIDGVKEAIMTALRSDSMTPHLHPPPQGGRT